MAIFDSLPTARLAAEERPPSYSVTKLKTYTQCGEYYNNSYIRKLKSFEVSPSTIMGVLMHEALEVFFGKGNLLPFLEVFERQGLASSLANKYVSKSVKEEDLTAFFADLVAYCKDYGHLQYRASADCLGRDAIRTKDGKPPANPTSTTAWKEAVKTLDLEGRARTLANKFKTLSDLPLPFVEIFADTYYLASKYEVPAAFHRTLALEFPISSYDYTTKEIINPVLMPTEFGGGEGIYLNGYVDWVGYVNFEGRQRLAVVDYKTSKENLTKDKLAYHVQLLTYAYALGRLLGQPIEVIGVHSLRHNKLVLTSVDKEIMQGATTALFSRHLGIKAGNFQKDHYPDSMYSPCLSMFGRECPFLQQCHPKMFYSLHPDALYSGLEDLLDFDS